MCGINLIVDKLKQIPPGLIEEMTTTNRHRGPDSANCTVLESDLCAYHLGANQLKISDLSDTSGQPFMSTGHRQALLFNGEIYNYYELKNELLRERISFQTNSDTEVLFHYLQKFGKQGIDKLEGMFAFIYIDLDKDHILIARDRFGIKPIYFFENEEYFIASSEIKSILATGIVTKALNDEQIPHYLAYKYVKAPETMFKNIYSMAPGTMREFGSGRWSSATFYTLSTPAENVNSADVDVKEIEEMLKSSLLRQLNSRVPVGLLLSGGVDSTLLLALAHKEGFAVPTFSVVNSKSDVAFGTEDFRYSKLAAKTFCSEHHEVELKYDVLRNFDLFIKNIDQPIGDSSQWMTSEACRLAGKKVKVLLSGAGADELFAGYNRHQAFYSYLNNKPFIEASLPAIKPLLNTIPSGRHFSLRKRTRLLKKLANAVHSSPSQTYLNFLQFHQFSCKTEGDDLPEAGDLFEWALRHDLQNYLQNDVLALSDHASMQHSIELRVPYLDESLERYLSFFPAASRIRHGRKWILRKILKENGGGKFVSRTKEGFGMPLSSWLMKPELGDLWDLFGDEHALIFQHVDRSLFERLYSQQKAGKEDHGPLLWSILVLGHWLEHHFG